MYFYGIMMCLFSRALAKNCNVAINSKTGAEAEDWKGGKPVRVVRNCKGRKHSTYAPEEGNRYDGIYKVGVHACLPSCDSRDCPANFK